MLAVGPLRDLAQRIGIIKTPNDQPPLPSIPWEGEQSVTSCIRTIEDWCAGEITRRVTELSSAVCLEVHTELRRQFEAEFQVCKRYEAQFDERLATTQRHVKERLVEEIARTETLLMDGQKEYENSLRDNTQLGSLFRMGADLREMTAYLKGLRFSAAGAQLEDMQSLNIDPPGELCSSVSGDKDTLISKIQSFEEPYAKDVSRRVAELTELLGSQIHHDLQSDFNTKLRQQIEILSKEYQDRLDFQFSRWESERQALELKSNT
jgi:hypothetical protein